ncbi:hypothetical protein AMJ85_09735 [candidate division BRC1 bacterium SM23_51]|nr:MAG: hypothetical protein AMJ85_09735 [candidate division BRC1 bacterium SM23_51]
MLEKEKRKERNSRPTLSPDSLSVGRSGNHEKAGDEITGILSERIKNLGEAIEELDNALATRKALSRRFLKQIEEEMKEVHYQLGHLQPPWKTGFYPKIEFLRLSLHKSLTSRQKDIRTEELKYWQDVVGLLKEKRKFLDEYKSLLSTKKRLVE